MTTPSPQYDVVIIGAGNAALCAALAARDEGASALVLEKAPASEQGGNCPYTGGGFRFVHDGLDDLRALLPDMSDADAARVRAEPYSARDFRNHFAAVTRGDADQDLIETVIARSRPTVDWLFRKGVRWELPSAARGEAGAPSVIPGGVGLSARDSGPGLVRMLTAACRRAGVAILYETAMTRLLADESGAVVGVEARDADGVHRIAARAVVLACGGFEANAEMRAERIGLGWERAKARGSAHNTGDGIREALALGAAPYGQWTGCHATPIDADAPATGDLRITDAMPRRSYPLGVTVNRDGLRFADEGAGFAEQTFVEMGGAIVRQPGGLAYQIFDARAMPHLESRYGTARRAESDSVRGLASAIGVSPDALAKTMADFNAAAHRVEYAPRTLDGRSTGDALPIPKSNWAIALDAPPFAAYAVAGGIAYTYGGLKIDAGARVLDRLDTPIAGLYAAGIIVGGIFVHGSLRAAGLMHGAVFGKIAGANAAGRCVESA